MCVCENGPSTKADKAKTFDAPLSRHLDSKNQQHDGNNNNYYNKKSICETGNKAADFDNDIKQTK